MLPSLCGSARHSSDCDAPRADLPQGGTVVAMWSHAECERVPFRIRPPRVSPRTRTSDRRHHRSRRCTACRRRRCCGVGSGFGSSRPRRRPQGCRGIQGARCARTSCTGRSIAADQGGHREGPGRQGAVEKTTSTPRGRRKALFITGVLGAVVLGGVAFYRSRRPSFPPVAPEPPRLQPVVTDNEPTGN